MMSLFDGALPTMKPTYKLVVAFLLFAAFVSGIGFAFDRLLLREGVPRLGVLLLSNALTGLIAGVLFLQHKIRAQEQHRLLEQRLEKIAEMNHHVRNALQVVAFYRHQISDPAASRLIQDSIDRIEWTLEEVLPRGWDIAGGPAQRHQTTSTGSGA
jgi:hypothetical protein